MDGMSSQNSVPLSGIDKSRVLDVKPLRCVTPIFSKSPQTPPFVCPTPFGPYPPGFTPFYPFNIPESFQNVDEQSQHGTPSKGFFNQDGTVPFSHPSNAPIGPTPIRSYRAVPLDFESSMDRSKDTGTPLPKRRRRARGSINLDGNEDEFIDSENQASVSRKKKKKAQGKSFSVNNGFGPVKEFPMRVSSTQREDGDKETVDYVLTMFDALRRKLSQMADSKEVSTSQRADLKTGNILMSTNVRTNMKKRIGSVPGVEIGDIFFFRMEMCVIGLHSQIMAGIDPMIFKNNLEEEPLAISIVSSGGYDDDAEDSDILVYSGHGGSMSKKDKAAASDQKLKRGNLALDRSSRRANHVRVIRGVKDPMNPLAKVYFYDGLYSIQESWTEKAKSGFNAFKYKFVRLPGQPDAFSVWKSIQKWKDGSSSRPGLILPDLTSGAENLPVSLVNEIDDEKGPAHFTYSSSLKNAKSFTSDQPSLGCNCTKPCVPGDLNCSCIRKNGGDFPYTINGVLVIRKPLIHECGPTCPCLPSCKNRVTQTGFKVYLEVFKTKDRGWGLRSWDPIRAGTFICEYAGEVIENVEHDDEYIFDTTHVYDKTLKWNYEPALLGEERTGDANEEYNIPVPLRISSKNVGNVARFMNHSCYPNVFWQPVVHEFDNKTFLHIAFYAIKHIPPMTELTYSYGVPRSGKSDDQGVPDKNRKCLCGSPKCRGYF